MNALPGLDAAAITTLVESFYDRVRKDPQLGPIFESRVQDWPAHKRQLVAFWCSIKLRSGDYRGNPVVMHRSLPLTGEHFERWLSLWRETAHLTLTHSAAEHMARLAERIGHGLMLGMGLHPRGRQLGVPLAGRWRNDRPDG